MITVTYEGYGDGYDSVLIDGEHFGIIGSDDDRDDDLRFKSNEHDEITSGDFNGLLIDFLPDAEEDEDGYVDDEIPEDDDERWIEAYHAFVDSDAFTNLRNETVTEGLIKIGKVKSGDEIKFA